MSDIKPIHARPSLYGFYFEAIKEIGFKYGYNIVLHGSMNRDLDLIAIPWQEVIGNKVAMINEIAESLGGHVLFELDEDRKKFREKYHGRECWVVNINRTIKAKYTGMVTEFVEHEDPQYYIDISILPHSHELGKKEMLNNKYNGKKFTDEELKNLEDHINKYYKPK